jgi:hypothetical protein
MPPAWPTQPILADMVWPALILEQRILSVLPIAAGLAVEWLVLWRADFGLSWKRAAVVDLAMNTVSTGAGIVTIPVLGFLWEIFPGLVIYKLFNIGTFNPGTWLATFVMAVLATTSIEAGVVRWGVQDTAWITPLLDPVRSERHQRRYRICEPLDEPAQILGVGPQSTCPIFYDCGMKAIARAEVISLLMQTMEEQAERQRPAQGSLSKKR